MHTIGIHIICVYMFSIYVYTLEIFATYIRIFIIYVIREMLESLYENIYFDYTNFQAGINNTCSTLLLIVITYNVMYFFIVQ